LGGPFVVAFGFATAAITLVLIERFGTITASWLVAGGFTLIGLVATLAVSVKEHDEEVAEKQANADSMQVAADTAARAAAQMPMALLGAVLSTPMGPSTVAGAANLAARNMPLFVFLALIALLFWPSKVAEEVEAKEAHVGPPKGASLRPRPNGYHHEAAA
jgi:hypothetical protein